MATYIYNNAVYVGVFAKKNGVWSKITTLTIYHSHTYGSGGQRTLGWSASRTVQLGTGVEAFGLGIDGTENGTAALTAFTSATWTGANPGSGVRSATPNGQSIVVTVQP